MAWKRLSTINTRCTATKVALAGAGVTIGVGAYLLAVKIKRANAAVAPAARVPTVDPKPISIGQAVGGGHGLPRKTEAASEEKQPCGGCDCGLMEPGPIEGTMHAYERHVIICRLVPSAGDGLRARVLCSKLAGEMHPYCCILQSFSRNTLAPSDPL